MKHTDIKKEVRNKIDKLFIDALEEICKASKSAGIKPDTIGGINLIIHPKNKSHFSNIKAGRLHIPLNVLAKFAEAYNVDMNYFFHDDTDLKFDLNNFLPASKQQEKKKEHSGFKLNDIDFKEVNIEEQISFETEELARTFKLDTLIRTFANLLPEEASSFFYNILHIIKFDYEEKVRKLKLKVELLGNELREASIKIQDAQKNENDALRALLKEKT